MHSIFMNMIWTSPLPHRGGGRGLLNSYLPHLLRAPPPERDPPPLLTPPDERKEPPLVDMLERDPPERDGVPYERERVVLRALPS